MAIIGKEIGDNIYVHITAVGSLCFEAQQLVNRALDLIPHEVAQGPNVAKVSQRGQRVSLLEYADFDDEPFPLLKSSWAMATSSASTLSYRSYERSANPPILHRKELLVSIDHPRYSEWAKTTETCETLGLFDESKTIGFLLNWERVIARKGFLLVGSEFFPLGNDESSDGVNASSLSELPAIQRHLTAMARTSISAPVQMLLRHGLINKEELFFDYGCGRGDDLNSLVANGYRAVGWDPHYAPTTKLPDKAHAVNLGFVVNVIEDPAERVEAIAKAFQLTSGVLSVGVMLHGVERGGKPYGDGVLTSRGTFQKYFSQAELKDYLEQVLHQESFLVAPGIAFVFADKEREQHFLAAKCRSSNVDRGLILQSRRLVARRETKRLPRTNANKSRLEAARPVLDVYWETALALGRHPDIGELPEAMKFTEEVPTFRRLKRLIQAHYPSEILEKARQARSDDLRLYFAVQQFSKRPRYRQLESRLQKDIFEFFGDYTSAHSAGLQLLRDASDPDKIHLACMQAAEFGLGEFNAGHSLQLHVEMVDRKFEPSLGQMHESLEFLIEKLDFGIAAHFAKRVGIGKPCLHGWRKNRSAITLEGALQVSSFTGLDLASFFEGQTQHWVKPNEQEQLSLELQHPPRLVGPYPRVHDWPAIRLKLKGYLRAIEPLSVTQIGLELDIDDRLLYLHANDLARQLAQRLLTYRERRFKVEIAHATEKVRQACDILTSQGIGISPAALETLVPRQTMNVIPNLYTVLTEFAQSRSDGYQT